MDEATKRDFLRFASVYGSGCFVKKLGSSWIVDFRGHGFPTVFQTKQAATEKARAWELMVSEAA